MVETTDDLGEAEVATVPRSWVRGDCIFWPKRNQSSKARKVEEPDESKWALCKYKLLKAGLCKFDFRTCDNNQFSQLFRVLSRLAD